MEREGAVSGHDSTHRPGEECMFPSKTLYQKYSNVEIMTGRSAADRKTHFGKRGVGEI